MALPLQDLAFLAGSTTLANDESTPMTFRVLSGPMATQSLMTGQPAGVIQLEGRSLPYRPLVFSGTQRCKTTWYAGNTSATQQVMGATLDKMTMNGMWKDRFLGDGVAAALCIAFDSIRKMGSPIEMIWGGGVYAQTTIGTPYVRRGILTSTKWSPDRPQDIAWEMEFEWASEGEVSAPVLTVGIADPASSLTGLRQGLQEASFVIDAFRQSRIALLTQLSQPITSALLDINATINVLSFAADTAAEAAGTAGEVQRHILEQGVNIADKMNNMMRDIEDAFLDIIPCQSETKDSPEDTLGFLDQKFVVLSSCSASRQLAVETGASLSGQIYPTILTEVRPPAGTDLRDLAQQYYGDADLWFVIAQFNGLTGSIVPSMPTGTSDNPFATRALKIPNRQDGALGSLTC